MFVDMIVLESDHQDALLTRLRLRRTPGVRCRVRHVQRLTDLPRVVELCGPALIITDLMHDNVWGALALARIQSVAPWVPVVVMTDCDAPDMLEAIDRLQPAARLDKSTAGYEALPEVVAGIVRGGHEVRMPGCLWPMSA